MLLENPWHDKSAHKVGLVWCYIADALSESIELTAELTPDGALGQLNPKYSEFTDLIAKVSEECNSTNFLALKCFIEGFCGPCNIIKYDNIPDIRLSTDPQECLSIIWNLYGVGDLSVSH